ncbi:hypothetical protein DSUL_50233 [Desulfovibrionales bacterium]
MAKKIIVIDLGIALDSVYFSGRELEFLISQTVIGADCLA